MFGAPRGHIQSLPEWVRIYRLTTESQGVLAEGGRKGRLAGEAGHVLCNRGKAADQLTNEE